jgi:hypothetical protein
MARDKTPKFGSSKPANKPVLVANKGKGSKSQMLPSRHALTTLTKGDPSQRSIQNYAKLTPIGAGAPGTYDDIIQLSDLFKKGT